MMNRVIAIAPLVQGFFLEHLLRDKCASPQTVSAYRDTFRLLLAFLGQRAKREPATLCLADCDAPAILAFLDHLERERQNTARSRNARLAAIRSFARYVALCEPAGLALVTRVLAIPRKRTTRRLVGYLTRAEMDACLAVPDRGCWTGRRDHALLLTLYNSGARVSEVAALRRSEVRFGASPTVQLHGKGRKERVVPLWPRTARVLQAWFRELGEPADGFAFPNARGGRLTRHGIAYLLRRVAARARQRCPSLATKQVSPHVVRHALAMHLLQAGVAPAVIALWLGHESVETTHMYVEADLTMKERALASLPAAGPGPRPFKASDNLLGFLAGL